MQKFSQPLQAWKAVAFGVSHHGYTLVMLYIQFLCSDWWAVNLCGNFFFPHIFPIKNLENLCYIWKRCLLIAEGDRVLCHLVMFLSLFPLDVQNEIHLPSRFFCYSWLICLLEVEKWASCQSNRKSIFFLKRVEKSQVILAFKLLDGFQELHLDW